MDAGLAAPAEGLEAPAEVSVGMLGLAEDGPGEEVEGLEEEPLSLLPTESGPPALSSITISPSEPGESGADTGADEAAAAEA